MSIVISPEKLAEFQKAELASGSHGSTFYGTACALEWVSVLADEGFTDAPQCASRVLRRYVIHLNDSWDHERRQTLKPYLLKMIGTGGDGKDAAREQIAMNALLTELLAPWYRMAGMLAQADALADLVGKPTGEQREALARFRDDAWRLRNESRDALRAAVKAKVQEVLKEKAEAAGVAEAAVAAVAAEVAGVAGVAGVAEVAEVAVAAVAAGVAEVAEVAVAAVVAEAAVAAVAAVAAEAAVAAVAAGADFSYGSDGYWRVRDAARAAARKYYAENPPPVMDEIKALAANQQDFALELLDRLIDPVVTA